MWVVLVIIAVIAFICALIAAFFGSEELAAFFFLPTVVCAAFSIFFYTLESARNDILAEAESVSVNIVTEYDSSVSQLQEDCEEAIQSIDPENSNFLSSVVETVNSKRSQFKQLYQDSSCGDNMFAMEYIDPVVNDVSLVRFGVDNVVYVKFSLDDDLLLVTVSPLITDDYDKDVVDILENAGGSSEVALFVVPISST